LIPYAIVDRFLARPINVPWRKCQVEKLQACIMNKDEPPSSNRSSSSLFFIGRNRCGNWVVQDQSGRRGGLFLDRAQALKFVKSENGGSPPAVIMVKGLLELDMRPVRPSNRSASFPVAQTALPLVA